MTILWTTLMMRHITWSNSCPINGLIYTSGNISFLKERWLVVQFFADKRTAALFFFIVLVWLNIIRFEMVIERLGNVAAEHWEVTCQHIVEITCNENLIVSDDVDNFLDMVVILVSDIHLPSIVCRYESVANGDFLVIGFDDLMLPFNFFFYRGFPLDYFLCLLMRSCSYECTYKITDLPAYLYSILWNWQPLA